MALTTADIIAALSVSDGAVKWDVFRWLWRDLNGTQAAPAAQPEVDKLLTVQQAAEELQYAPSHIYELCRDGSLVCSRDGKLIRIRRSALAEFIAKREQRGQLPLKVSNMLHSGCDRQDHEAQAQTTRIHPAKPKFQLPEEISAHCDWRIKRSGWAPLATFDS
jgi:excisionase family DNA binding protein